MYKINKEYWNNNILVHIEMGTILRNKKGREGDEERERVCNSVKERGERKRERVIGVLLTVIIV